MSHAIVLVSGGGAVTPFTTPGAAAARGLAAGNSLTALRSHLLDAGHAVYTAPARIGAGEVREDDGWQGFADVPLVLPADVTINAVGGIDDAGEALAGLLRHLADAHGVTGVDLVGHSMGGLFSRAAIRIGRERGDGPAVRRLVTLGTPWTGALLGDVVAGDLDTDADGDATTSQILHQASDYAAANSQGAAAEVSERFLAGGDGWNARQAGVLDGIPVTLIAGGALRHEAASGRGSADPRLWPHDGLVSRRSARAELVPDAVLPLRRVIDLPDDVHSIFFSDALGLPWTRAITWDPAALAAVAEALSDV